MLVTIYESVLLKGIEIETQPHSQHLSLCYPWFGGSPRDFLLDLSIPAPDIRVQLWTSKPLRVQGCACQDSDNPLLESQCTLLYF